MKDASLFHRFEFLLTLIRQEGHWLKHALGHHPILSVRYKGQDDLVTQFDLDIEKRLIQSIQKNFPKDAFLSEEAPTHAHSLQGITWVIDPIDGTTNFVHGYPFFCLSIAVAVDNTPYCGAVYNPMHDELFFAITGGGAYVNNHRLAPIQSHPPTKALLVTGFPYQKTVPKQRFELALSLFSQFQSSTQAVRRDGSAALDLCYVAAGRFTGFFETGLHPWDVAAGMVIATEAGAVHLDFEGRPTTLFGTELVCAHPKLATVIAKEIREVKRAKLG